MTRLKKGDVVIRRTLPPPDPIKKQWGRFEIILTLMVVLAALGVMYIIGVEMEWLPDYFGLNSFKTAVPQQQQQNDNGTGSASSNNNTVIPEVVTRWSPVSIVLIVILSLTVAGLYLVYGPRKASVLLQKSLVELRRNARTFIESEKNTYEKARLELQQVRAKQKLMTIRIKILGRLRQYEEKDQEYLIDEDDLPREYEYEIEEDNGVTEIKIIPKSKDDKELFKTAGFPSFVIVRSDDENSMIMEEAEQLHVNERVAKAEFDLAKRGLENAEQSLESLKSKAEVKWVDGENLVQEKRLSKSFHRPEG